MKLQRGGSCKCRLQRAEQVSSGADRIHAQSAHHINRHVVEVAPIDEEAALVKHRRHQAYNGHAGAHKPPQQAALVYILLALRQIGGYAEKPAKHTPHLWWLINLLCVERVISSALRLPTSCIAAACFSEPQGKVPERPGEICFEQNCSTYMLRSTKAFLHVKSSPGL